MDDQQNSIFAHLVILLNLFLAGLRLGLKNYQVSEKWILDDYLYLCKGLKVKFDRYVTPVGAWQNVSNIFKGNSVYLETKARLDSLNGREITIKAVLRPEVSVSMSRTDLVNFVEDKFILTSLRKKFKVNYFIDDSNEKWCQPYNSAMQNFNDEDGDKIPLVLNNWVFVDNFISGYNSSINTAWFANSF